jgi:hypothetical protein
MWRCPECGHPFNPHWRDTFTDEPRPRRLGWLLPSRATSAIWLGTSLALGLLLTYVPIPFVPWLPCILVPLFPFWQVVNIWLALNLIANESYGGLVFWIPAGCVFGALLGVIHGPFGVFFGFLIGAVVGLARAHWEI